MTQAIGAAIVCLAILATPGAGVCAQTAQAGDAVAEVRQTLSAARAEIAEYTKAGGALSVADHPAVKWDAALWAYRDRYPRSEAAALASAEAVRLLVRAQLWDRADARVASLDVDDAAWERLPAVVYEAAIARKDVPSSIERLSKIAGATTNPRTKASALLVLGRAYRRQADIDAASRSLEAAKAAAPGSPFAEEADGILYEIRHLSPGLPAPKISAKARSGRTITLDSFRGKVVVLVFWGTT